MMESPSAPEVQPLPWFMIFPYGAVCFLFFYILSGQRTTFAEIWAMVMMVGTHCALWTANRNLLYRLSIYLDSFGFAPQDMRTYRGTFKGVTACLQILHTDYTIRQSFLYVFHAELPNPLARSYTSDALLNFMHSGLKKEQAWLSEQVIRKGASFRAYTTADALMVDFMQEFPVWEFFPRWDVMQIHRSLNLMTHIYDALHSASRSPST